MDALERFLTEGDECADILMLLAAIRGSVNSLIAEILENHSGCTSLIRTERPNRLRS